MTTLYPVAGCHFYIGTAAMDAANDLDATDFAGVTWIECKKWINMGPVGDASQLITTPLIDEQRDVKQKGTRDAGNMDLQFGVDPSDAGQIALIAAEGVNSNYPFRVDFNDAVGAGAPSKRYFVGLVASAQEQGGGANTVRALAAQVAINSNVVRVDPT